MVAIKSVKACELFLVNNSEENKSYTKMGKDIATRMFVVILVYNSKILEST